MSSVPWREVVALHLLRARRTGLGPLRASCATTPRRGQPVDGQLVWPHHTRRQDMERHVLLGAKQPTARTVAVAATRICPLAKPAPERPVGGCQRVAREAVFPPQRDEALQCGHVHLPYPATDEDGTT